MVIIATKNDIRANMLNIIVPVFIFGMNDGMHKYMPIKILICTPKFRYFCICYIPESGGNGDLCLGSGIPISNKKS